MNTVRLESLVVELMNIRALEAFRVVCPMDVYRVLLVCMLDPEAGQLSIGCSLCESKGVNL